MQDIDVEGDAHSVSQMVADKFVSALVPRDFGQGVEVRMLVN